MLRLALIVLVALVVMSIVFIGTQACDDSSSTVREPGPTEVPLGDR